MRAAPRLTWANRYALPRFPVLDVFPHQAPWTRAPAPEGFSSGFRLTTRRSPSDSIVVPGRPHRCTVTGTGCRSSQFVEKRHRDHPDG